MEQIKKRSDAIDMVKGLSIMTLFYLHFENGWMQTDLRYLIVRSPAFYMVVGWLWGMSSHHRSVAEHWQKRKKGLVIPYLWFSLIFIILDIIMLIINWVDPVVLYRDIYKTLCLRGIGTLWFLPALLGGEILLLSTRDKSWVLKLLLYVSSFCILCLYYEYSETLILKNGDLKNIIDAPFRVVSDICSAFIFMSIAYYFSAYRGKQIFNASKTKLAITGILCLLLSFYLVNYFSRLSSEIWFGRLNYIIFSVLAGIGILFFFRAIETFKPISKPLVYCGKNSLIIMAVHWGLYLIALGVDKHILHHAEFSGIRTLVYFGIACIVLIGIIELINRKLRFIIGK